VVDTTAPTASLDDPGASLGGTVHLTATASDATSGVQSVSFQWSPAGGNSWTTISTDTAAPYTADFDTSQLTDGHYDLRVFVTDVAGNTSLAQQLDRVVDNT